MNKNIQITLTIIFVLIISASLFFMLQESSEYSVEVKRGLIEQQYPEFVSFENQDSFAGKEVTYEIINDDYYFVYKVLGSGIPIINATCFHVDAEDKVSIIGTFPISVDSYAGYTKIDAQTCKGIRPETN